MAPADPTRAAGADSARAGTTAPPGGRSGRWAVLLLVLLVAASAGVRAVRALADPVLRTEDVRGLLRSDPALLYYLTSRVEDAGGRAPEDFRADPRIEWPDVVDVPAEFAVGQEFLVAWAHRALAPEVPLHVFCLVFSGVAASLALVGVFGLAREATGCRSWGLFAAGVAALLPASHRTLGFVLMREDLSFPLFAAHLWLLARALGRPGAPAFALAALPLVGALATWHAAGFLLALEVGVLVVWASGLGRGPRPDEGAWAGLVVLAVGALAVPVLRAQGTVHSLPVLALGALVAAGAFRPGRSSRAALAAGLAAAAVLAALDLGGASDYRHVLELVLAKLVYLGRLPPDPRALSFDARLLWQGPFATSELEWRRPGTWLAALLALLAARAAWRFRREPAREARAGVLALGVLASGLSALFVQRMAILPAVVGPALAAVLLSRTENRRLRRASGGAVAAALAVGFALFLGSGDVGWYPPAERRAALRDALAWIDAHVPEGEAVVGDFVTSPAVLAHTGRPIALQPKYEAGESRRRAGELLCALYHEPAAALAELVRDRFRARFFLVDRESLGGLTAYVAGVPPLRGIDVESAAGRLLRADAESALPGFVLCYPAAAAARGTRGAETSPYRIYEIQR